MKWTVRHNGKLFDINAPNKAAARKLAEERARKLRLPGDIESVEPFNKENATSGKIYVVMDSTRLQIVFAGGLPQCAEHTSWYGDIRVRSSTGRFRPLTEAERTKFFKFMGRVRLKKRNKP